MKLDILVILDRSGSMEDARSDHEGGLKSFVKDQNDLEGDVRFTLVQFDSHDPCEIVYDRVPIGYVKDIKLIPRGGTPLLDGVGSALAHLSKRQADEPSDATVVMIITDGLENASKEWTRDRVKARIEELQKQNFKFLYLGANVDAFHEAGSIGIPMAGSIGYANVGGAGTVGATYQAVGSNMLRARQRASKLVADIPIGAAAASYTAAYNDALDSNLAFSDEQREETVTPKDPNRIPK